MKKIIAMLFAILPLCAMAQKNEGLTKANTGCQCNQLETYVYFYYDHPTDQVNSNLLLRFDYNHKGKQKCTPEFLQSVTIQQGYSPQQSVSIPVGRLATSVNTVNGRIFTIPQADIPFRVLTGKIYRIKYTLTYGTSPCPVNATKIVRFEKDAPIL